MSKNTSRRRKLSSEQVVAISIMVALMLAASMVIAVFGVLGAGIELEKGQPAPFSGVLITQRNLAELLANMELKGQVCKANLDGEREKAKIRAKMNSLIVASLSKERDQLIKEVELTKHQVDSILEEVDRWRPGICLGFILGLKSPDRLDMERFDE